MLLCILIPLAVGALAGWLIRDGMIYYKAMVMPLLSPPGWVFPVVWTLLYILMGIASCLVYCADASQPRKKRALILYGVQLIVTFIWPLLFFRFGLLWVGRRGSGGVGSGVRRRGFLGDLGARGGTANGQKDGREQAGQGQKNAS